MINIVVFLSLFYLVYDVVVIGTTFSPSGRGTVVINIKTNFNFFFSKRLGVGAVGKVMYVWEVGRQDGDGGERNYHLALSLSHR